MRFLKSKIRFALIKDLSSLTVMYNTLILLNYHCCLHHKMPNTVPLSLLQASTVFSNLLGMLNKTIHFIHEAMILSIYLQHPIFFLGNFSLT